MLEENQGLIQTTLLEKLYTDGKEFEPKGLFDSKQRRAYGKLLTGMKLANKEGEITRFLSLTTSDLQLANVEYSDKKINDSFRKLKQRITRQSPYKLLKAGYITKSEMNYYYGHQNLFDRFKFNYFKVATNEGNGVIHTVYKGSYLPYTYLVDNWQDIHNSWDLNIKRIGNKAKDLKKSSSYVVSQYMVDQGSSYQRSSMSWDWIIRAYATEWNWFKKMVKSRYFYSEYYNKYFQNGKPVDIYKLWLQHLYEERQDPYHELVEPLDDRGQQSLFCDEVRVGSLNWWV